MTSAERPKLRHAGVMVNLMGDDPSGLPLVITREEALLMAHRKSGISMTALAAELGVSTARVSQLIKRAESGLLR